MPSHGHHAAFPAARCPRAAYLTRLARRGALTFPAMLLAALGCREDTGNPAAPEPTPATATASAVQALAFSQLSSGGQFTCGLTPENRAYCWGDNGTGQLGDGTTNQRLKPIAVTGGRQFRQVTTGFLHTCGVTAEYRAYCWGDNRFGQVGDGTTTMRLAPVAVGGGRRFRQVDGGYSHTCGVSYPDDVAYCWGSNNTGQLGNGTTTDRLTPTPVMGGLKFRQVRAGSNHTCGLTTTNQVWCWGWNRWGQIGDSSSVVQRLRPSRIAGTRQYRELSVGGHHACAVTTDDRAFCWGSGREGELGTGKTYLRYWPTAVAGGLFFTRVSAGGFHTCGETRSNRAYCWGRNFSGQLGDGTTTTPLKPVAVTGGLYFGQVNAGFEHTCGKTPGAVAYCWGSNAYGQLGDGSTTQRPKPGAVAGPME